ncbi:hypothetical protein [Nannocystis punicea]|uniref:Uncharacterized protein n=1 Tax=Nannocystis punicea TaxID=2995304 RepID=A0ABY7H871_9BACT|nr:hypothetical protein [Nannocystis poenicansa]WAS95285.1 hypothetical protein O0S08_03925 [Nannocystis poenicansa]
MNKIPGAQLTDPTEQVFRQVHPSWIQQGRPTSQAFKPTPKDAGLLSVSRAAKTTAAASFELHTQQKGLASVGVWAFSVSDCTEAALNVFEDPVETPVPDPAHTVVDFRHLDEKTSRAKAQLLKSKAEAVYARKGEEYR